MISVLAFLTAFVYRLSSLYPSLSPSNAHAMTDVRLWSLFTIPWSDPTFPILKLLSAIVPAGNSLFRMNLFSALLAGLTAALLMRVFLAIFPLPASSQMFVHMEDARWRKACAWICSLALVAFPPVAEIFREPNAAALTPLIFLWTLLIILNPVRARFAAGKFVQFMGAEICFAVGLGTGSSAYFLFFVPGLLDFIFASPYGQSFLRQKKSLRAKIIAYSAISFAAGLLIMRPSLPMALSGLNWSAQGMIDGAMALVEKFTWLGQSTVYTIHALAHGFSPLGLLLCLWGVYNLQKKDEQFARAIGLLVLGAFIALPWTVPADRASAQEFSGLSLIALFLGLLVAYGIHDLGVFFFKRRNMAPAILGITLCLGLSLWNRENLHARELGLNLFQSLPENSIFIPRTQPLRDVIHYTQKIEGLRRDLDIRPGDNLSGDKLPVQVLQALDAADPDQLIFFERDSAVPQKDLLNYGLAARYFPAGSHRLLNPPAQISLLRFVFWCYHRSAPWNLNYYNGDGATQSILQRYVDAHLSLAAKCREFGLDQLYHLENLAALSLSPRNYQARKNLGEEALERKEYGQAAAYFRDALKVDATDAVLHFHLGQALQGQGRGFEALQAFKNAVDRAPDFREARRDLAEAQDSSRRYADALAQWKWLMDKNPQDKDTVWRLLQDYHYTGQADKAKELLQEYFLMSLTPEEKSRADVFYDAVMERGKP